MTSTPTINQPAQAGVLPFAVVDDNHFLWMRDPGSDTYTCRWVYGPMSGWVTCSRASQPLDSINVARPLQTEAGYRSYVFGLLGLG